MNEYKPYSIEWSRKRYLSESIQKYFDDDVSPEVVLDDILDILDEFAKDHRSRAEKFQYIIDNLKY